MAIPNGGSNPGGCSTVVGVSSVAALFCPRHDDDRHQRLKGDPRMNLGRLHLLTITLLWLSAFWHGAEAQSTIEFWHAMEGPKAPLMDEMAKEFMKEYPAIKVNVSLQGGYTDMVRKIQAGIMANALPDVAMLGQRHGIPNITDSGK